MSKHLAAAEAAFRSGRAEEGLGHLLEALEEDEGRPASVYRALLVQLYRSGRTGEGEAWSARAVARHAGDGELWNMRGVFLRQLRRHPEALKAFETAIRLRPSQAGPQVNRGNVLLDMGDGPGAEAAFSKLVRSDPRNAELQRLLGRALQMQGRTDAAMARWRQAAALAPGSVDAWLDMAGTLMEDHRERQAHEVLDRAFRANPDDPRLHQARIVLHRRAGALRKAEAYITEELLPRMADVGWVHHQLGATLTDYDRDRANMHLRRGVELAPEILEHRMVLIESLERTRSGDEGAHIEAAFQQLNAVLGRETLTRPAHLKIASEVLTRVCAFDQLERLGSFRELGRAWAQSGRHTALLKQLGRVRSDEDRLELLEQHRIWGRQVEAAAAKAPIRRPPPRAPSDRIRLGFMSSDLRRHPVAYFALPLFDHVDKARFEVFCYSFYQGEADPVQRRIAEQVSTFRWTPEIAARDAAQMIADDQLDLLLELGGTTHMNKLEALAWRPAPRQGSWLGYPHSAGLASVDYFVCDPYSAPTRPDLLVEQPLKMPHSWLALGPMFGDNIRLAEAPPEVRNGFITFGTANNPHKYSRQVLRTWARIVAAEPGSKFAFIRPEGGAASFRKNVLAEFAAEGVGEDRVIFHAVRGAHMPLYNEVDITLDPFPLTGGTTTCEALWMGVPVVSLAGEAFYERLSYSILTNAGLGDLCATDLASYAETAHRLAADLPRRVELRRGLRDQIRRSPLGQGEAFARDFYDMIWRAMAEAPAARA